MSSNMNILLKDINNESLSKSASSNSLSQLSSSNKLVEKSINSASKNEPETYCVCKKAFDYEDDDMMIECDVCKNWFHGRCVGMNQRLAADIEIYVCPGCLSDERQIIYKKRYNSHRNDYSDPNAQKKPIQAGTATFCEQLLKRQFPDAVEHGLISKLNHGSELTLEYLEKNGLKRPILVEQKDGLDLVAPSANEINLSQIEDIVGADYVIDVIDVERQEVFQMSINELNTYFKTTPRTKVYNLISFEISKTELTKNVTAPRIVNELSWASNGVWPLSDSDEMQSNNQNTSTSYITKPEVHKYCLISAAKSYTDFHIDFGGSSVWYHTVKGDKIFYLIEPTDENLSIYEKWSLAKNHSEVFLGDKVKQCYKFTIKEGNTIFLPTGWIHAVYTPQDSLVFGGNFLQSYNIPLQLKIYEMELRLKTPEKYRFPAFETLQWYAARYYTQKLKELNADRKYMKINLFHGLRHLKDTLKRWLNSKDYYEIHDYQVPQRINSEKLVNVMNRELTKQEALLKSNGAYASENSLKLKLKINPTSGQVTNASATSTTSSTTKTDDKPSKQQKADKKKEKEVLVFNQQNISGIKVEEATNEPAPSDAPKPLKLKLKLNSDVYSVTPAAETHAQPSSSLVQLKIESVKSDSEYESDSANREDDEIINDLKNSYQDDDFVYPSINIGTTARTAAKKNQSQTSTITTNDTSEKTARKRKLKPHVAQYLQPKNETKPQELPEPNDSNKDPIDLLIEKNLKENLNATSNATNKREENNSNDTNDTDYVHEENDDEEVDDDDDDYDFKAKCQQNLKLSKKLKKNSVKHQKDMQDDELKPGKTKANGIAPSAIGSSSINSKNRNQQPKKFKKGFATSKQRLGKLLKINRIVNI